MILKKLSVNNFGRIQSLLLPVSKMNLFIGPNGVGKSTVLNSMTFATTLQSMDSAAYPGNYDTSIAMEFEDDGWAFSLMHFYLLQIVDDLGRYEFESILEQFLSFFDVRADFVHGREAGLLSV